MVGEKLPLTMSNLIPAIKPVNYQALVWVQDDQTHPALPSGVDHLWHNMENGLLISVMCETTGALEAILQLMKCSCTKTRCPSPCKCLRSSLPCTSRCACGGYETVSDNVFRSEDNDEVDRDISDNETEG